MVTLLGFLQLPEIILQLLGILPGRAIDALEHLVVLIAAPVGTGNRHQLERILLDLLRVFHVRPAAQVRERVVLVDRDFRLFLQWIAIFIEAAFFETFDQFQFIGLVGKDFLRFISRENRLLELVLALDDLAHPLFDLLQILRREVARQVKVIVKTVLDRGADRVLGLGEHFQHSLRHDMRGGVTDFIEMGLLVFFLCNLLTFSLPFWISGCLPLR